MTDRTWILEIYDHDDVAPKRVAEIANVSEAKAVIHEAWRNHTGEIFRFFSNCELSGEDKAALTVLGAKPTFG